MLDTSKPVPGLIVHEAKVTAGTLQGRRRGPARGRRRSGANAIRANHSATHLLHQALKVVLGDHVKQAGSVVAPDYLRFDYSHFRSPRPSSWSRSRTWSTGGSATTPGAETKVMGLDEAKKSGAVALFGEKYGDKVRVVTRAPRVDRALRRHPRAAHRRHRPVQDHLRGRHRLGRAAHRRRSPASGRWRTCGSWSTRCARAAELLQDLAEGAGQAGRSRPRSG